jgi:hypothetical protein
VASKRRVKKAARAASSTRSNSRLVKLAEKQAAADAAYKKALGLDPDSRLPKALGDTAGHGGAQPQVGLGSRARGTRTLPSNRATPPKKK